MKTDQVGGKLSRGSVVYLPQRISVMRRKVLATMVRSLLQLCRASSLHRVPVRLLSQCYINDDVSIASG